MRYLAATTIPPNLLPLGKRRSLHGVRLLLAGLRYRPGSLHPREMETPAGPCFSIPDPQRG
jgi:hypothetical protein